MRISRWSVLAAAAFAAVSSGAANAFCSDRDLRIAENVVYTIGTWRDLYSFFGKFGECDSDALSAGLSDRVADLLSRHWDTIGDLRKYVDDRPKFVDFVMLHIDTLMRKDQANAILANAHDRCPADADALCKRIETEVRNALPNLWGGG